eukprot:6213594-Pleurochrysis_carterae.AAC.4
MAVTAAAREMSRHRRAGGVNFDKYFPSSSESTYGILYCTSKACMLESAYSRRTANIQAPRRAATAAQQKFPSSHRLTRRSVQTQHAQ